jgi:hypothetical protein
MASITLSKRITLTDDTRHRLRIWVSETTNNIPAQIFVYQRIPLVPLDTELQDIFVHIASYADIQDYPSETPDDKSPFFRQYFVDLVFDSLAILEENWVRMARSVQLTVEDIARLNDLPPVEIIILSL